MTVTKIAMGMASANVHKMRNAMVYIVDVIANVLRAGVALIVKHLNATTAADMEIVEKIVVSAKTAGKEVIVKTRIIPHVQSNAVINA